MAYLHESLRAAPRTERKRITTWLMQEMRDGSAMNEAFHDLCLDVINDVGGRGQNFTPAPAYSEGSGEFAAASSAEMVKRAPRVMGYLRAIDRVPQVETAVEGGTGSSALLSLAVVALHPSVSRLIGYEINDEAATAAQAMVELCGMDDKIEIRQEDVLRASIPDSDLGITETFNAGLLFEPGHKVTAALARSCRELLPAEARIWALDDDRTMRTAYGGTGAEYQFMGAVDLTRDNDEFQGSFSAIDAGERFPVVIAGFFDARGGAVIAPGGGSDITHPIPLSPVWVDRPGDQINFRYRLGSHLSEEDLTVWTGKIS